MSDSQFLGLGQESHGPRGEEDNLAHEIQILCRLNHPNVVHLYGGCLRPPRAFIVEGEAAAVALELRTEGG